MKSFRFFSATFVILFVLLSVFISPIKAEAQTTGTNSAATDIYAKKFAECKKNLGFKLIDPAQSSSQDVVACISDGQHAAGDTTGLNKGVIIKQVAAEMATALNAQYSSCIANAKNDTQITACAPIKAQADTALAIADNTMTNAQVTDLGKANAKAIDTEAQKQADNMSKCTSIFDAGIKDCIDAGVTWLIKNTLLEIAGFLVWVSANMLNLSIQVGILDFAKWAPDTLYPIWVIIRQIISLFVVFAGLYLGFMYIIGREKTFEDYVPWIIMFALFVNFSYPLTRTLIDISNVISLKIYAGTIGTTALVSGDPIHTAGALIMDKLGLQSLVMSATSVNSGVAGFTDQIKSTPGALMAVAYVLYAAYIFFMVTALIAVRTAMLVFLIVGSPLLFVDSIIPKLGDHAAKLRQLFVEQLAVAPVFMIMLALTLKFLEIFQTSGALSKSANSLGSMSSPQSVQVFFNILMMLIMLHIMLTVTKSLSGKAGEAATGFMGKVGGFGLGVATGGVGLLARGSLGMAAARMRDSKVMDSWQGSKTGRGLYNLTNSLATSTYDARNVGMVSKGMATAGMGMGKGQQGGYDTDFKLKNEAITKKYGSIRDATAREDYLKQKTSSVGAKAQRLVTKGTPLLGEEEQVSDAELIARNIRKSEDDMVKKYLAIENPDKKQEYLESLPKNVQEKIKNTPSKTSEVTATKSEGESLVFPKISMPSEDETGTTSEFNLHTEDFATRIAQRRTEKQKIATEEINKQMQPLATKEVDNATKEAIEKAKSGEGSSAVAYQNNNPEVSKVEAKFAV